MQQWMLDDIKRETQQRRKHKDAYDGHNRRSFATSLAQLARRRYRRRVHFWNRQTVEEYQQWQTANRTK